MTLLGPSPTPAQEGTCIFSQGQEGEPNPSGAPVLLLAPVPPWRCNCLWWSRKQARAQPGAFGPLLSPVVNQSLGSTQPKAPGCSSGWEAPGWALSLLPTKPQGLPNLWWRRFLTTPLSELKGLVKLRVFNHLGRGRVKKKVFLLLGSGILSAFCELFHKAISHEFPHWKKQRVFAKVSKPHWHVYLGREHDLFFLFFMFFSTWKLPFMRYIEKGIFPFK